MTFHREDFRHLARTRSLKLLNSEFIYRARRSAAISIKTFRLVDFFHRVLNFHFLDFSRTFTRDGGHMFERYILPHTWISFDAQFTTFSKPQLVLLISLSMSSEISPSRADFKKIEEFLAI